MVHHRSSLRVVPEGPEAVEMDFFAEAGGHRVHEEPGGRTFYVDIVG